MGCRARQPPPLPRYLAWAQYETAKSGGLEDSKEPDNWQLPVFFIRRLDLGWKRHLPSTQVTVDNLFTTSSRYTAIHCKVYHTWCSRTIVFTKKAARRHG
jgi:hypothetical protein